jgi:hypothetical protein
MSCCSVIVARAARGRNRSPPEAGSLETADQEREIREPTQDPVGRRRQRRRIGDVVDDVAVLPPHRRERVPGPSVGRRQLGGGVRVPGLGEGLPDALETEDVGPAEAVPRIGEQRLLEVEGDEPDHR